jgi:hypothetical protein
MNFIEKRGDLLDLIDYHNGRATCSLHLMPQPFRIIGITAEFLGFEKVDPICIWKRPVK